MEEVILIEETFQDVPVIWVGNWLPKMCISYHGSQLFTQNMPMIWSYLCRQLVTQDVISDLGSQLLTQDVPLDCDLGS